VLINDDVGGGNALLFIKVIDVIGEMLEIHGVSLRS
jgi:hypothetical protein